MALLRKTKASSHALFPGFGDVVEIGVGSLATVFRAREGDTGRLVALKLLNVRDASPRAIESFERESVALGSLSAHPNIVTLFRTFRTADGRPVLVLELCEGAVADRLQAGLGLPVQDAVSIGIKVSGALETAHRAGILHRDVKPQNILVTEFGEPALADFGVAMLQSSTQTTAGLFDFTTLHAAPELLEGQGTSAATDVYELASSLYQLIAGQSAFRAYDGESPASVILRILRDPVRPLAGTGVPVELSDLLIRAMSKDKDSRPPTAHEFASELARIESAQGWPRTQFLVRGAGSVAVPGQGGWVPDITRFPEIGPRMLPPSPVYVEPVDHPAHPIRAEGPGPARYPAAGNGAPHLPVSGPMAPPAWPAPDPAGPPAVGYPGAPHGEQAVPPSRPVTPMTQPAAPPPPLAPPPAPPPPPPPAPPTQPGGQFWPGVPPGPPPPLPDLAPQSFIPPPLPEPRPVRPSDKPLGPVPASPADPAQLTGGDGPSESAEVEVGAVGNGVDTPAAAGDPAPAPIPAEVAPASPEPPVRRPRRHAVDIDDEDGEPFEFPNEPSALAESASGRAFDPAPAPEPEPAAETAAAPAPQAAAPEPPSQAVAEPERSAEPIAASEADRADLVPSVIDSALPASQVPESAEPVAAETAAARWPEPSEDLGYADASIVASTDPPEPTQSEPLPSEPPVGVDASWWSPLARSDGADDAEAGDPVSRAQAQAGAAPTIGAPAIPNVPTWTRRAQATPMPAAAPQFVGDIAIDPHSLRPKLTVRSGMSALTVDEHALAMRTMLHRERLPWSMVSGFEPHYPDGDTGPNAKGVLLAITPAGAIELPATRRLAGELKHLHALVDAYRVRAGALSNR